MATVEFQRAKSASDTGERDFYLRHKLPLNMASLALKRCEHSDQFTQHLNEITHNSLKFALSLAFILVPLFYFLDLAIIPTSDDRLCDRFGMYRLLCTLMIAVQLSVLHYSKPSGFSLLHGYLFTINVGSIITLMTVDLGGFNSRYYAGLNLVIIAFNFVPWKPKSSIVNGIIMLSIYLGVNVANPQPYEPHTLWSNLYFLISTIFVVASLSVFRHRQILSEFQQRLILEDTANELVLARKELWGEMEVAKKIQTALVPGVRFIENYEMFSQTVPASLVGGDYYDHFNVYDPKIQQHREWMFIGDVSGHGIDSGLIMMMIQTSIQTYIRSNPGSTPSHSLGLVNSVIMENLSRMNSAHYATLSAVSILPDELIVAGSHQEILLYRKKEHEIESIFVPGSWIGVTDNLANHLTDISIPIHPGDIAMLFTDGITEAENCIGKFYGIDRLERKLLEYSHLSAECIVENILSDVEVFQKHPQDDVTLIVLKKGYHCVSSSALSPKTSA